MLTTLLLRRYPNFLTPYYQDFVKEQELCRSQNPFCNANFRSQRIV